LSGRQPRCRATNPAKNIAIQANHNKNLRHLKIGWRGLARKFNDMGRILPAQDYIIVCQG
jgi:hypothetical protein